MRIRVRLFAIHRELAGAREVPIELADGATVEDAWRAMTERHPLLAPGRPSVRFARNGDYAEPATILIDGDELAFIPPVSGGAAAATDAAHGRIRILELHEEPFPPTILADLEARLASDADGGVVGFVGRTRRTPGTPAPGQEAQAARHEGRSVEALSYEAHDTMAIRVLDTIADEIEARFGVERLAIVHRTGIVPLGATSIVVVAASEHRDAAFQAARYAIDETKARAPIWKAETFDDGHVWIGQPARNGPMDA